MAIVKTKVKTYRKDYAPIVPVMIPDLAEVRAFAAKLHAEGKAWKGETFGWQAEYNPERPEPPLDSKMTFTPADFCIGESGIWFFSLMWEHGRNAEPVEFLDDKNILMSKKAIPKLKSNGEFADFVDSNDMTEYDWQETEEIQIERVPKKAVNMRIHPYVLNEVKKIAAARKIPYSTLMQQWLAERVAQEKLVETKLGEAD